MIDMYVVIDWQTWYTVLVKDWADYNGWAEKFHIEAGGIYK